MVTETPKLRRVGRNTRKTARTFRLTPGKIEAAQKILGVPTATEAIETALDLVIFREELIQGTRAGFDIQFNQPRQRR